MVRALLDGSKTQTRRVVKWRGVEPGLNLNFSGLSAERSGSNWVLSSPTRTSHEYRSVPMPCPYGQPGDQLWVRETFRGCRAYEVQGYAPKDWGNKPIWFEADGVPPASSAGWATKARPSIHMPRWASRINLEITGVRVECLHDISQQDALAEGYCLPPPPSLDDPRNWYRHLWEQINGAGSWALNPWVWVVEFRRLP